MLVTKRDHADVAKCCRLQSWLTIVIVDQAKVEPVEETDGKEELLDKAEEAVDMADEVTGTITDQLTEETQKVEPDGTISVLKDTF